MGALILKNVRIPAGGNDLVPAEILVEEGIIAKVGIDIGTPPHDFVVDGRGGVAVPGGIDIHAHVFDPDYTHHEDFRTGSIAAAFGGITTFFDMPLRMYVENSADLKVKVKNGVENSLINFSVIAGMMNEDNLHSLKALRDEGVKAFKLFTCEPFRPRRDSTLAEVIRHVDEVGGLTMIHAEDDSLIDYLIKKFKEEGRADPLAHHLSRPAEGEASAIRRVVGIAAELNSRIHVVHVSSKLGAEEIRKGKVRGVKVTAETCPHYLAFTLSDVEKWGNYLKMNPSLKTGEDVKALWEALASGVIDAVTTDHAPSTPEEKEVGVWEAWGGIPGLETMLPFLFTKGVKELGILTLQRFVEVTSSNPARIMGIYPRKGAILPGSDADIAVLNPDKCKVVKGVDLHHKCGWTPYEGMELCGWPVHVLVNGSLLIEDGELVRGVKPGKFLRIT